MSHPLPFGIARHHARDCELDEWIPAEAAPEWEGHPGNPSIRPPGGKLREKPRLFMAVVHVSSAGEQTAWKRVM